MIAQIEHKNATLCQIKSNLKLVHSNVNLKLRCTVVKVSELGYTNIRQCKKKHDSKHPTSECMFFWGFQNNMLLLNPVSHCFTGLNRINRATT